jgi:hypothetical protein
MFQGSGCLSYGFPYLTVFPVRPQNFDTWYIIKINHYTVVKSLPESISSPMPQNSVQVNLQTLTNYISPKYHPKIVRRSEKAEKLGSRCVQEYRHISIGTSLHREGHGTGVE